MYSGPVQGEIDVEQAAEDLQSYEAATERLRVTIWSLATREEILELADSAKKRAWHEFDDA